MSAPAIEIPSKRAGAIDDENEKLLKRARIQRENQKLRDLLNSDDLNSQLQGLALFEEDSEFRSPELLDLCIPIILDLLGADDDNEQLLEGALDAFRSLIYDDFTSFMGHRNAARVLKKLCYSKATGIADETIRIMALAARYSQANLDVIINSGLVGTLLDLATCEGICVSVRSSAIETLAVFFFATKERCTWYEEQAREVLRAMNSLLLLITNESILLSACTTTHFVFSNEYHKLTGGIAKEMLCSLLKLLQTESRKVLACAIRAITSIVTSDSMQMKHIDSEAFSRIRDFFVCYCTTTYMGKGCQFYVKRSVCKIISLLTRPCDIEVVNKDTIVCLMDVLGGGDYPIVKAAAADAISNVLIRGSSNLLKYVISCMPSAIAGGINNDLKRVIGCIYDAVSSGSHDPMNEDKAIKDAYVHALWWLFDYARRSPTTNTSTLLERVSKLTNFKYRDTVIISYKRYLVKHGMLECSEEAGKIRGISVLP